MKKIVIVDDYLNFAEILTEIIANRDQVECVVFNNPLEVLSYVEENNNIDILLVDYQMPQMSGFELAQKVLINHPNMSIVIMSGYDEQHLEKISRQYNLEGKVKLTCKGNIDFFYKLSEL